MSVQVLNIPLFDDSLDSAVGRIIDICLTEKERSCRIVSATSAHGLVYAQKHNEFAQALKGFYWNLPDGIPGVWLGKLKGAKGMERCYGPELFERVIRVSSEKPVRHFLCGGKQGVAENLGKSCAERFQNTNCVGVFSPPFREMTDPEIIELAKMIGDSGADIVWIGLSTPKQELFAQRLSLWTKVHFIITVGAAFDFHTGRVKQAPKFLQRVGLEWFFRLMVEPKRLYKRYAETVPSFLFYGMKDLLSSIKND